MRMPELAIDPFRADEFSRWRELFGAYNTFYGTELGDDVYRTTWSRIMEPGGPLRALAARNETGVPIGLAHYLFHRSTWAIADRCYLEDLFVAPTDRRRGLGRKLIEAVATAARARGCDRLHWLTHESNAVARRVYDALTPYDGFIQYTIRL